MILITDYTDLKATLLHDTPLLATERGAVFGAGPSAVVDCAAPQPCPAAQPTSTELNRELSIRRRSPPVLSVPCLNRRVLRLSPGTEIGDARTQTG